jgi:hypothetical protein
MRLGPPGESRKAAPALTPRLLLLLHLLRGIEQRPVVRDPLLPGHPVNDGPASRRRGGRVEGRQGARRGADAEGVDGRLDLLAGGSSGRRGGRCRPPTPIATVIFDGRGPLFGLGAAGCAGGAGGRGLTLVSSGHRGSGKGKAAARRRRDGCKAPGGDQTMSSGGDQAARQASGQGQGSVVGEARAEEKRGGVHTT